MTEEAQAGSSPGSWRIALAVLVALNLLLLLPCCDRSWIPADDGIYAHVADRLVAGEVLNADAEELHSGAIHLAHAQLFRLLGRDLRYPLVLLTSLQSCVLLLALPWRGKASGVVAALAPTALGFIQYR